MDVLPAEINIITLNCWGLKYISKLRSERLVEIGRKLATAYPPPHIVALQECWTQDDYQNVRRETRFALPYGKFYHSGVFGAGLAILSRWPIEESTMFRYPLNGRPTAFFRGDWFVGKGVACAKLRYGTGPNDVIEVFNTHTHPSYEKEPNDSYACHRAAQAWEMAKLLRGAAGRGHLVLGLGDFNAVPQSLPHRLITTHAPVRDAWHVLHPDSALGPADSNAEKARRRPVPTAEFNVRENGVTSDSVYNTWRWPPKQQKLLGLGKPAITIAPATADPRGKRLDYIFVSAGDPDLLGGARWVVKRAEVGMLDRHPTLGCSLSDHFSVEATLSLHAKKPEDTQRPETPSNKSSPAPASGSMGAETEDASRTQDSIEKGSYDDAMQHGAYLQSPVASEFRTSSELDDQVDALRGGTSALPLSTYDEILAMIHKYAAREQKQQKWRGAHFFVGVAVTIISLAAVWFSPPYVAFVLVLLSSLGLASGTVDGLISLLFINTELRALDEFKWEIMNAKSVYGGAPAIEDHGGTEEEAPPSW